jgi:hypothetical protein
MKLLLSIFLAIVFFSCSNFTFPGLGRWKEFDQNKGFAKYKKFPIALLLYSSSDNEAQKIVNNKSISSTLGSFTLLTVDVDRYPYILRRFGENTPSLSFIDSDGNSIYSMYPVDTDKLKVLVPQLLEIQHHSVINKNSIREDLSFSGLYPGEEREIAESVLKKLGTGPDVPLDLLSYSYRDTGDEKLRQLILNTIKSKLSSKLIDPISSGVWSKNGYAKLLEDFAAYYIELDKIAPYCRECLFNLDYDVTSGLNFVENELKSDTPLYYAGLKVKEPYNLFITEQDLTNLFGNDGFKKLEKAFSLSYMNTENKTRYILFSPKIVTNIPTQELTNLKKYIDIHSAPTVIKEYRAYGNILLARLYVKFGYLEKAIVLKNNIDKYFKDKAGLIELSKNAHPYLRDQNEYLDLLIDIYKITMDAKSITEAVDFSQLILKSFCEEWGKVVLCSDLPYDVIKKYTGFLSLPDYSITFNSRFALSLLRLYAMNDRDVLFKLSFNILSTFRQKAKKMTRGKINKPLLTYTKALISLHSNPLKLYLINLKPVPRQDIEKDIKQKINNVGYPSVILTVIKNSTELSALYAKEKGIPSEIKGNILIMCLGDECSSLTRIYGGDLAGEIEKFIAKNTERVLRVIPFWQ